MNQLVNALGGISDFIGKTANPEGFYRARADLNNRKLGNALSQGDYSGAANMAFKQGNIGAGLDLVQYQQGQAQMQQEQQAAQRQKQAQGTLSLFKQMEAPQISQMALEQPDRFQEITGMTPDEYMQLGQSITQSGRSPEEFRQYVIQQAMAELGQMPQQPEEYTLSEGSVRYRGDEMIANNPKAQGPLSTIGKLRADLDAGRISPEQFQAELAQRAKDDPSLSIDFGEGGSLAGITYGSAPKGKEAAIVQNVDGGASTTPGPQQQQYNKAYQSLVDFEAQNSIVMDDIGRAIESISGMSAGPMAFTGQIPIVGGSTPAGELGNLLDTIKANVGFDKLQNMRENSPTGGALGQVSEREIAFLQAVFGSMSQDQTPENLRYNLERLQNHLAGREQRLREAFARDFPTLSQTADFRSETNRQIEQLTADEQAELEQLRRELGVTQ